MAGLPSKYMKMKGKTLKQKWAAYYKVHPKGGKKKSRPTKKKSAPKKKSTYRRSYTKAKAKVGASVKNKMTPSNIAKMYAIGGSGIHHGLWIARGGDASHGATQALRTYTGFDMETGQFKLDDLTRGYGGMANEAGYRKFARALGFQAYPTSKPKNFSQMLDYVCMYGAPVMKAYANKDNPQEANREVYKSLNGVDLGVSGFASYQPAAMAETKGVYALKKLIFKYARQAGYSI